MGKKPYEFVDLTFKREIEGQLENREETERAKVFKVCLKCKIRKSLLYFGVDSRSSDNRVGVCKACRSQEALKYYYINRERILSEIKEARKMGTVDRSKYFENYRETHKEHLKVKAHRWYKKNKKRIKKRNIKYYEENKEACQAIRELWLEKNKEKIKKYNREYHKLKMKGV
jgi:hypothetical protein